MNVFFCYNNPDKKGQHENLGWPIFKITIGPGRNQEKVYDSIYKRLLFGTVKVNPITYFTYKTRLRFFLFNAIEYVFDDPNMQEDKKLELSRTLDNYLSDYDVAEVTEELRDKCEELVKEALKIFPEGESSKKLENFRKGNDFSAQGIWISKSEKPFSFV
jgi:hypothetical protein